MNPVITEETIHAFDDMLIEMADQPTITLAEHDQQMDELIAIAETANTTTEADKDDVA